MEKELRDGDIIAEIDLEDDIKDVLNLSNKVIKCLHKRGIYTLRELLDTEYNDIKKTKRLGEAGVEEIRNALKPFGFTLKNADQAWEVQREKRIEEGYQLLETYGWPKEIYSLLYQNGIFTLEDVENNLGKIETIKNYGPKRQSLLRQYLKQTNIEEVALDSRTSSKVKIEEEKGLEERLFRLNQKKKKKNKEQREKVEKKEALVTEYYRLLEEQAELQERERKADEELAKIAVEGWADDLEEILKHFNNLNNQLLEKMYKEKAEEIFKCIPMKMEQFYEAFDRECMNIPIFKYYDVFQLFQRISCASNEDIVLIKEKLINRAEKYTKEIEPEMKNIKQLKQVLDNYLEGKDTSIKIVMLKEFSKGLGLILDKYKISFLPKKED